MQDNSFFLDVEGLYQKAYDLFSFGGPGAPSAFRSIWDNFYFWLQFASFGISIILFVVLVIILIRRKHIILEENKKYALAKSSEDEGEALGAEKWQKILELVESSNPNDWKTAIIDADIILEDMMGRMGYQGQDLGEKLKSVEKSDFETLDNAWQAHKVRNRIAHSGSDFVLTPTEARQTIDLYRRVFEEFHYI